MNDLGPTDGLAGVRVQGQARGPGPPAAAVRALPPPPRLADVVRGALTGLRRAVVQHASCTGCWRATSTSRGCCGATPSTTSRHGSFARCSTATASPPAAERAQTHDWWVRELVGEFLPPVTLRRSQGQDASTASPEPSRTSSVKLRRGAPGLT